MNPKELRHGNYVMDRGRKILRVDFFDGGKVCQRMTVEGQEVHPLTEYFEELHRIRLTDAILLAAGFTKTDADYCDQYQKGRLLIEFLPFGEVYARITIDKDHSALLCSCKHVHTLQNAYFMVEGKELNLYL